MNALKHGLLAQHVVLPTEDEHEFQTFSLGLEQQLQPVGELEGILVDSIAAYAWRLRRLVRVEKGLLIRYTYSHTLEESRDEASEHEETEKLMLGEVIQVYKDLAPTVGPHTDEATAAAVASIVTANENFQEARRRAKEAKAVRDGADGILGLAFITDAVEADAFAKLSRYESHIQRSMFKALNELQSLQAVRGKKESTAKSEAPPPLELKEVNGDRPVLGESSEI